MRTLALDARNGYTRELGFLKKVSQKLAEQQVTAKISRLEKSLLERWVGYKISFILI